MFYAIFVSVANILGINLNLHFYKLKQFDVSYISMYTKGI